MLHDLREQYEANKKQDRDRRDTEKRESRDRSLRRWWHLRQRDPLARFTLWLVISTAALVAATVGTMVVLTLTDQNVARQVRALNQQLDLIELDQRPYIWTKEDREIQNYPSLIPGSTQFGWNVPYTNYGKRIATQTEIFTFIKIGNKEFVPSENVQPMRPSPTFPNKVDYITVFSPPGVTQTDWQWLLAADHGIAIALRIEYSDVLQKQYTTFICLARLQTGAIAYWHHGEHCKNDIR